MKPIITHLTATIPTDSTNIPVWFVYLSVALALSVFVITVIVQKKNQTV